MILKLHAILSLINSCVKLFWLKKKKNFRMDKKINVFEINMQMCHYIFDIFN